MTPAEDSIGKAGTSPEFRHQLNKPRDSVLISPL